jgi:hypothetical protein
VRPSQWKSVVGMRVNRFAPPITLVPLSVLLVSCGGGGGTPGSPPPPPPTTTIAGVVQKGPFLSGSSITVQPLDSGLNPTGTSFNTTTTNDSGSFSAGNIPQNAPIEVTATGFYYDEVRDTNSGAQITLRALAQSGASGSTHANTNVLTGLALQRIKQLATSGSAFSAAKSQAESEVLAAFGIPAATSGFETLDYSANSGDNAKLLAASALTQQLAVNESGQPSGVDAALSLFVSQFGTDLADNGVIDGTTIKNQIEDAINTIDPAGVVANLSKRYQSLGTVSAVPDFSSLIHRTVTVPVSFSVFQIASSAGSPAIVVTPDHVPHVLFVVDATGTLEHAWLSGGVWSTEILDSNVPLVGTAVEAVGDQAGGLHVSWGSLYESKSAGATIWTRAMIDTVPYISGTSVAVAANNSVGISYVSGGSSPNTIKFATVAVNGTISAEYVADTGLQLQDSTIGQTTCVAFDSQSAPHVIWNDRGTVTQGLRHAIKTNGQWVVSTLVPGVIDEGCSVLMDSSDVLHVSYKDISTRSAPVVRQATISGATLTQNIQTPSTTQTTSTLVLPPSEPALVTNTAAGLSLFEPLHTITAVRIISAQQSSYSDAKWEATSNKVHVAFSIDGGGGVWYGVSH